MLRFGVWLRVQSDGDAGANAQLIPRVVAPTPWLVIVSDRDQRLMSEAPGRIVRHVDDFTSRSTSNMPPSAKTGNIAGDFPNVAGCSP